MWVRVPSPAPKEVINLLDKEKKTKELLSYIAKLEKKYEDKIAIVIVSALRKSEKVVEEADLITVWDEVADKIIDLYGLAFGLCVRVIIGLDIVWQLDIKKQAAIVVDDECEILQKINNASGKTIKAPHSLKNILVGMQRYPQVCQWIRLCIKNGVINEQSYRRLQEIYRTIKSK